MKTDPQPHESPAAPESATYRAGPLRGLNRNVLLLGWVSFFADVSSEMLYPLIPLFLTGVLGAPVGLVGVIEGCAEAVASILKPLAGRWSDRLGRRRRFIAAGYSMAALAKGLLALAGSWPLALLARVTDRFGKGLRSAPRDALLSDSVDRAYLGKAFGVHRGMDTLGAVVGPLLALMLLQLNNDNLRQVLWLAVVPGLLGAGLVLLVRDRRRQEKAQPIETVAAVRQEATSGSLPTDFRRYLLIWVLFAFCNSSDVFILLRASELGLATTSVVLLYCLYNLSYALASPFLGSLSDVLGRRSLLIAGLLLFALVYCGFAFASSTLHLLVLFLVYGLYMAATEGVSKAFAMELVPAEMKGTASGMLGFTAGAGALVASIVAGLLWEGPGPWLVFAYGAVGALLAAIGFMLWKPAAGVASNAA
ncbi:MFS transporter [bacterium]|nr:MFS transporter [bacterium]